MEAVREKSVEYLASYLRESGVPDIYCECFEGKVSLCIVVMFIFIKLGCAQRNAVFPYKIL